MVVCQSVDVMLQGVHPGGGHHSCALLDSGAVRCWGWKMNGQLGDGSTIERHTPAEIRF
jgi:alpha-tubulin suppressor-like RCC1 family protein